MMKAITIIDDILSPAGAEKITYQGKNTFLALAIFPRLMRDIMKIEAKDTLETNIRWDASDDPRKFYGMWMGIRKNDRWTKTKIRIIIQGTQDTKERIGNVTILLKGTVETSYEFSNFIQRGFWWAFNYWFYYKQRRMYMDYAKDDIKKIKHEVQRALGILPPA
ncbi:MAG: hypothetical protein V1802_02725 [Candidatus Aenigmatarchaeota archaeon]